MPITFLNTGDTGNISFINDGNNGRIEMNAESSVVTNGLILSLDAGNPASYPGTGTTWYDLSGNNNSGSLINTPTFNSADGGYFTFNGINQYASLVTNFFNHNAGTPFSVSIWFKTTGSQGIVFGQQSTANPGAAASYVPATYIDTTGKIRTSCFWGGATANQSVSSLSVNNGTWRNITVTYSNPNHISYLDGVQYATLSKTQTSYGTGNYYYFLGTGTYTTWPGAAASVWFSGSIASMLFYNNTLSPQQVLQNYNATKTRFGL